MARAVKVGLETNPFLADFAEFTEAEDLKTAAVREDGTLPVHKGVQPPELPDQFVARTQIKMIGITQNNLGPEVEQRFGQHPLDRALGSHWHKTGVSITPLRVWISPRRAWVWGSFFNKVKLKLSILLVDSLTQSIAKAA